MRWLWCLLCLFVCGALCLDGQIEFDETTLVCMGCRADKVTNITYTWTLLTGNRDNAVKKGSGEPYVWFDILDRRGHLYELDGFLVNDLKADSDSEVYSYNQPFIYPQELHVYTSLESWYVVGIVLSISYPMPSHVWIWKFGHDGHWMKKNVRKTAQLHATSWEPKDDMEWFTEPCHLYLPKDITHYKPTETVI